MGKIVCSFGDVPKGHHWMILTFSTVHTPGDERSRTNPGHGYPASDDPVAHYEAFTDKAEWERAIEALVNPKYGQRKDFSAGEVRTAKVATSVSVSVET